MKNIKTIGFCCISYLIFPLNLVAQKDSSLIKPKVLTPNISVPVQVLKTISNKPVVTEAAIFVKHSEPIVSKAAIVVNHSSPFVPRAAIIVKHSEPLVPKVAIIVNHSSPLVPKTAKVINQNESVIARPVLAQSHSIAYPESPTIQLTFDDVENVKRILAVMKGKHSNKDLENIIKALLATIPDKAKTKRVTDEKIREMILQ